MMNSVCVMGRLVRDPELRYTQNQTPVASFTVAVDDDYSGKDGADRQADFIDCVAWRGSAEFISKYFFKGKMIGLVGRLKTRTYTDKNDVKRKTTEIVVDHAYFADSKRENQQGAPTQGYSPAPGYQAAPGYPAQTGYPPPAAYPQQPSYPSTTSTPPPQQGYYQGNVFGVPTDDDLPF